MKAWTIGTALVFSFAFGAAAACSASSSKSELPGSGGSNGQGGTGSGAVGGFGGSVGATGGSGGLISTDGSAGTGVNPGDGSCAAVAQEAKPQLQPADIIWGIDTSCSMLEETPLVQGNMNNFSNGIVASGIDVHIVLLAGYPFCPFPGICLPGICIPGPLGSGQCPPAGVDSLAPSFLHDQNPASSVQSNDGLDIFISSFPDWKPMLRPGAVKTLVIVTDDDATQAPYNSADPFIQDFTNLDPLLKDGSGNPAWKMNGIYAYSQCGNAAAVGTVWKDLIAKTNGVEGDICAPDLAGEFNKLFNDLATKIITGAQPLDCQWQIPPPPAGQTFDASQVNVEFTDDTGIPATVYGVADLAACDPAVGGWYYDNPAAPTAVVACPSTCDAIKAAAAGKINVLFGCDTIKPPQ